MLTSIRRRRTRPLTASRVRRTRTSKGTAATSTTSPPRQSMPSIAPKRLTSPACRKRDRAPPPGPHGSPDGEAPAVPPEIFHGALITPGGLPPLLLSAERPPARPRSRGTSTVPRGGADGCLLCSLWRPFDCGKIACAVNDSYDLRAVFSDAVKGEPSVDDERSRVPVDLLTGTANLRMFPEQLAGLLDAVIDAIGDRLRVPRGDIKPDVEKILPRAGRKSDPGHASRFDAAKRAR